MLPTHRTPTHPGEILKEEFLAPLGLSQAALAHHLGVSTRQIGELVRGRRGVTAKTAWLLSQAFDTSPQFWLNLQARFDLAVNRPEQAVAVIGAEARRQEVEALSTMQRYGLSGSRGYGGSLA